MPAKLWLFIVILGSSYHLIRDILQMMGVQHWSVTFLHKTNTHSNALLWHPFNTVVIEVTLMALAILQLRKRHFSLVGKLTIWLVIVTIIGFIYYWFFL